MTNHRAGLDRRLLLRRAGGITLSAAGAALLLRGEGIRQAAAAPSQGDVDSLNTILGLDHEAVAAYAIAAGSGLLTKGVLPVAKLFQGHHEGHRDALAAAIREAGGTPADAKTTDAYAKDIGADKLKSEADVLRLAAGLEGAAVNVYVAAVAGLADKDHARLVARLIADETMHWTVLTGALKEQLPPKPLSFGA